MCGWPEKGRRTTTTMHTLMRAHTRPHAQTDRQIDRHTTAPLTRLNLSKFKKIKFFRTTFSCMATHTKVANQFHRPLISQLQNFPSIKAIRLSLFPFFKYVRKESSSFDRKIMKKPFFRLKNSNQKGPAEKWLQERKLLWDWLPWEQSISHRCWLSTFFQQRGFPGL